MAMEITLRTQGDLDEIGEGIARRAWGTLTHTPGMEGLYPGYYVTIMRATEEHLWRRLTAEMLNGDGTRRLLFDGPESVAEFELHMVEEILGLLARELRDRTALPAVSRELPEAIHSALAEYGPVDVRGGMA